MTQGDHILKTLLSYWLTWLALAAVVALEVRFFVWFRPSVLMALVALALTEADEVYNVDQCTFPRDR